MAAQRINTSELDPQDNQSTNQNGGRVANFYPGDQGVGDGQEQGGGVEDWEAGKGKEEEDDQEEGAIGIQDD